MRPPAELVIPLPLYFVWYSLFPSSMMAHDTTTPSTDVPEQGAHYELTVCEHICYEGTSIYTYIHTYGPRGELLRFQRSSRRQASYLADVRGCVLKALSRFTANGEEICDDSKQIMAAAARNMTATIAFSPCTLARHSMTRLAGCN